MNSDLQELLGDCSKKHKLDESDPLLDEIAKTDRAIADSLAKIIQSRWLNIIERRTAEKCIVENILGLPTATN